LLRGEQDTMPQRRWECHNPIGVTPQDDPATLAYSHGM